ncbi:MAG TPA: DUF2970 domain-containing protein [Janthinobacterium sp.]|jgi:hypothetical protein|nr:DUF2970 domain-containing protein [Janthinobacterium sp.]
MAESNKGPEKQQASFLYSLKAVLWSFTGLRRKSDFDADAVKLNPVHIVIAAVIAVACLIGLLLTIVKFVVLK